MKTIKILMMLFIATILVATNVFPQEMKKEIILGCETSLLTAPVLVAENKGYFQGMGLNVKIKRFDSGKASSEGLGYLKKNNEANGLAS